MDYKKFDEQDLNFFLENFDRKRVFYGKEIREDYSHDEMGTIAHYPDILIQVVSTEEVSKVMKYAYDHHLPTVVRGSGTG